MRIIPVLLSAVLMTGCCTKIGPKNLEEDSLYYNRAVNNSTESQMLLNIVRLRYRDTPTFLQVGIVSASYENKYTLSTESRFDDITHSDNFRMGVVPKVQVDQTEKPTTTFQPVRGQGFVTEFLSPISAQTLMLMNHSGWRVDRIIRCCIQKMNGLHNAPTASGPTPEFEPEFRRFAEVAELFHQFELNNAIDIIKAKNPETGSVDFYIALDKEIADPNHLSRFWELLGLQPGIDHIRLVMSHSNKHRPDEINIDTRSPISMLYFLSHGVQVPEEHIMKGKVNLTRARDGSIFDWNEVMDGLFTIHSQPRAGAEPAVCVRYRHRYYYIDDSDLTSKATFSLLSQVMALQTGCPDIPTVVLPIGGDL